VGSWQSAPDSRSPTLRNTAALAACGAGHSTAAGQVVLYRLADDTVLTMVAAMHKVAERNVGGSSESCAATFTPVTTWSPCHAQSSPGA
jgi:hypothetical protein